MRGRITALGVCLTLSVSALAQNKTYTVRSGDSISSIATKHKVKRADLIAANGLENPDKLKLGLTLTIPGTAQTGLQEGGKYVTRNGDKDWTIARRFGMTVAGLQKLNPKVDFSKLGAGTKLNVGTSEPAVEVKATRVGGPAPKPTAAPVLTSKPASKPTGGTYTVREGDNDWVIAHKFGTTSSNIRALNPSIDWRTLQIGAKVQVPGGKAEQTAANRIGTRYAVVKGDGATIRRSPSTNGDKITQVNKGTQVTILDHESGWYKLKFPKGTIGWMRGDLLKPLSVLSAAKQSISARVARGTDRSSRSTPKVAKKSSTKSKSSYVASKTPSAKVDSGDLMARAMALRGTRYRWGGTSRSGFDCSGFVTAVYKSEGVKLPRSSKDMAKVGVKVPKDQLKPGDLVFFKTRRSSRINHVGIYAGNGKFIHSSSGKGQVRVDSLNSGYYASRMVTAKRVATPTSTAKKPTAKPTATASKVEKAPVVEKPKVVVAAPAATSGD